MNDQIYSVTEFHAVINQTLQFAYPEVIIEGEVSSYKVSQNKWIFFDLKDNNTSVSCFMPLYSLKTVIEDGMLIRVVALPNITKWGKFSITIRSIEHAGIGGVKKAFEQLKAKFESEGIFATERKRSLPQYPNRIALVTSAQAAAYADFITIINDRWAGLEIDLLQVHVQGLQAANQIIGAIEYFNDYANMYDVLVIIRGGGSEEDLQAFNDEGVVRAIFSSSLPTLAGIGHETDTTLTDLVADLRAATPSDAARKLVPDKHTFSAQLSETILLNGSKLNERIHILRAKLENIQQEYLRLLSRNQVQVSSLKQRLRHIANQVITNARLNVSHQLALIATLDPQAILNRGYAIVSLNNTPLKDANKVQKSDVLMIQLAKGSLQVSKIQCSSDKKKYDKRINNSSTAQTKLF